MIRAPSYAGEILPRAYKEAGDMTQPHNVMYHLFIMHVPSNQPEFSLHRPTSGQNEICHLRYLYATTKPLRIYSFIKSIWVWWVRQNTNE